MGKIFQLIQLSQAADDRLFANNVFAGFDGAADLVKMKIRRGTDIDDIDVGATDRVFEIGEELWDCVFFGKRASALGIDVANGDNLEEVWEGTKSSDMLCTDTGTDTDTETLVHLIEESPGPTLEARVIAALGHVEGTYGIAVLSETDPGKIVVARRGSPVLLGVGDGEFLVASDASAVLGHTRSVVYLNDGDVAVVTPEGYRVLDREAREQERAVDDIEWDLDAIALGGYPHFMLKEISEQAETVRSTLRGRLLVSEGTARLNGLNLTAEQKPLWERLSGIVQSATDRERQLCALLPTSAEQRGRRSFEATRSNAGPPDSVGRLAS